MRVNSRGLRASRTRLRRPASGRVPGQAGENGPAEQPALPADGRVRLALDDYADVGPMLAAIQASGATILDMEIAHADLEDVFLRLMREG